MCIRDRGLPEQTAFEQIKNKFLTTVILAHPNFVEPFYIHTDASDIALGVELFQVDRDCLLYTSLKI